MSLLNGMIEKFAFRQDESGRTTFYPWGVFGPAFSTNSQDTKDKLSRFYLVALLPIPFFAVMAKHASVFIGLLALVVYGLVYVMALRRVLRGLPDLQPVPSSSSIPTFLDGFSYGAIVGGLVGGITFVGLGIVMVLSDDAEARIAGLFAAAFFGAGTIAYIWLLIAKASAPAKPVTTQQEVE